MNTAVARFGGLTVLAVVLAALPLVLANAYQYDVVIRIAMNAIIVIGLNLLIGYTGQISLGHAGFFGIGAYATGVLTTRFDWSPMLAMLAGAVVVGILSFGVARPILKLRGHYLAMATLGLGIIISIVITNEAKYTGGPDGIAVPPLAVFGMEIAGERTWYWLVSALLVIVTWLALNLIDSPAGRALQAIHGSEVAAQVAGVDTTKVKVRIFVFSAICASVMGSLSAHYIGFVTPGLAGFFHSIELVTMVVVGGMASVFGSIVGAGILTILPQLLSTFEGWETVVFGAILMATMIFLPKGIVPTLAARFRREGAALSTPPALKEEDVALEGTVRSATEHMPLPQGRPKVGSVPLGEIARSAAERP
jgi:branched-chain amino acid transport system permease protein